MKKHLLSQLFILFAILISLTSCSQKQEDKEQMIERGDKLVSKIEKYQSNNNRLPESLSDIGITETLEGPFFYDKKGNNWFQLWFGLELGESCIYDSKRKTWE